MRWEPKFTAQNGGARKIGVTGGMIKGVPASVLDRIREGVV